jgi:DNA mismatch repair protein MutS
MMNASQFVPNNTKLGNPKQSLMLITGPNMAGKSVYLRQVALITLLAHMGSFVPAKKAYIPLVDSIFVRSGASDMISSGLSTFMVEMVETAFILNHATSKSLIVMDEIGRGTSTYDGVSIAWAVAEHLIEAFSPPPKTLFATHYHELIDLEKKYPKKLVNTHMDVSHDNNEPVFTHVLTSGPAYESYGVEVAKLAGIPLSVISRANKLLVDLHKKSTPITHSTKKGTDIGEELKKIDTNNITPLQALAEIVRLKKTL